MKKGAGPVALRSIRPGGRSRRRARSAVIPSELRPRLLLRRATRGTKGAIWQLTAIDIRSSFAWAELIVAKDTDAITSVGPAIPVPQVPPLEPRAPPPI